MAAGGVPHSWPNIGTCNADMDYVREPGRKAPRLFLKEKMRAMRRIGKTYSTIEKGNFNIGHEKFVEMETMPTKEIINVIGGHITLIIMDIERTGYRVIKDMVESGNIDRVGKGSVECHVDRMPHLAEEREKTLALARAEGVFQRSDFGWP